ncbi:MAG: hypothetical protein WC745_02500 [Patescibacteria group bacterium]|jgi:hypothetical protein
MNEKPKEIVGEEQPMTGEVGKKEEALTCTEACMHPGCMEARGIKRVNEESKNEGITTEEEKDEAIRAYGKRGSLKQ